MLGFRSRKGQSPTIWGNRGLNIKIVGIWKKAADWLARKSGRREEAG